MALSLEARSLMLQQQMESSALLRDPPKSAQDLVACHKEVHLHTVFLTSVGRLATRLQLPLEIVFQCLMHMSMTSGGANGSGGDVAAFDRQHRQGNVPMHQAKVLKRDAALEVEPQVRAAVDAQQLQDLMHRSSTLRALVRIKVEDGNDLSMVRRALTLADDYMQRLTTLSDKNVDFMWRLYNAKDEAELGRLLGCNDGADGGAGAANNGLAGSMSSMSSSSNGNFGESSVATLPMPQDLVRGVDALCTKSLAAATVAVAERQTALASIEAWFRAGAIGKQAPSSPDSAAPFSWSLDLLRGICALPSVRRALVVHLGEKRSALCRSACEIVSNMMRALQATSPSGAVTPVEIRDALLAWQDVLLKQVHVTVAAIANATDATVRDVIVATGGAQPLLSMCAQVAAAATQPELQRKAMGYAALGLVAHLHHYSGGNAVDATPKCQLLAGAAGKLLQSGTEGVRRVARIAGLLCRQVAPAVPIANWDERVDRAAAAERDVVLQAAGSGAAAFEEHALRFAPCSVSSITGSSSGAVMPMPTAASVRPQMSSDQLSLQSSSSASNILSNTSSASSTAASRAALSSAPMSKSAAVASRVPLASRANAAAASSSSVAAGAGIMRAREPPSPNAVPPANSAPAKSSAVFSSTLQRKIGSRGGSTGSAM